MCEHFPAKVGSDERAARRHQHAKEEQRRQVTLKDDKTGEVLTLDFVGIHQPVRELNKNGRFFACTDSARLGATINTTDIDFWMDETSGKITVGGVRVHKVACLDAVALGSAQLRKGQRRHFQSASMAKAALRSEVFNFRNAARAALMSLSRPLSAAFFKAMVVGLSAPQMNESALASFTMAA